MSTTRKSLVTALGLAVAATGLSVAVVTPAQAVSTTVVIQEVYGAGGNSGATYNADFVELYNPTANPIDLTGMSIQYRSATSTSNAAAYALSGTVAAGDTFLIQMSNPGANGAALPTPDATASPQILMAAGAGQVLLASTTTPFPGATTGNVAGNAALVDMVGYGTTATTFEGAPTGVNLTSTTAAKRFETGADTDDNASDFNETVPSPDTIPNDPDPYTIAEIQGTGAASPLVGEFVSTKGVVTARYPTGGYDGFYIQNGTTPDASDAVFVYAPDLPNTDWPAIGASVEVAGDVSEFNGITELTLVGGVSPVSPALTPVTPLSVPWADLDSEVEKESHEGELVAPQGPFTVTDSYDTDNYAEIGLASGTTPLITPTDVADAQGTADEAVAVENARRAIALDDGASINFREAANSDTPYPWLTPTNQVRVGAAVTFTGPVVLEFRNNLWKFQPQRRITGAGGSTATFANTRTAAPAAVGGDIRLATFNVLNYFPTTGEEFDAMPGTTCTFFTDRDGNRTTVNSCNPNGPRGAANAANLARQQSKIVKAINALDASVVSLEELENSAKFGKDRDFAISTLVTALNADAGAGTWAFVPTPPEADRPTVAQEDVIRTGFIYKPADVETVGGSKILVDEVNFDNAREPLAQVFKPVGGGDASDFAVIVNHFKSKGSGFNDGTGQGNANPDRIGQAEALSTFADSFATERNVDAVFLAGDFNAYTFEDPMQVLYDDGYTNLKSTTTPGEASYSFDGMSGSLDHVVANDAALAMVTGVDIWNINAEEAVAYEYSRYNSNETMLFDGSTPYKASDHNPEVVGLNLLGVGPEDIQIIGTNDYHGRLAAGPKLAGAVKQLREQNPNTVFAAAGDLIGATTFESFIAHDKPTIDVMNEAGLEVSAVGNHEFDQGFDDLTDRVMAPYNAETNPYGGAEWKYLGANVKFKADGSDALEGTWIKEMNGVQVGFVGAVTEDLPSLVSPEGIAEIQATDIVAATNEAADDLVTNEGADLVVLLVHEGSGTTNCDTMDDNPTSNFGQIIAGVNDNVDAIISGHTHLAYNCEFEVPGWAGRDVTKRPVVSAGQYGTNLNKLVFTVDSATGEVQAKTQSIVALPGAFPADPATQAIVNAANAESAVLGAQPLGQIAGGFYKAKFEGGTADNRGGESTLGNLVAEVQRWATETPEAGGAQIAFMNPGGLRADMLGSGTDYPRTLTYKQAADVQSFANTLVNMDMTGAVIAQVLEQQWQPTGADRPFLRLGTSDGFSYTYDPDAPAGSRILSMELNGEPIDPAATYSVTANSFLAGGGDNFSAFNQATNKADTGKVDLQAMVDYMDEFANTGEGDSPLPVDFAQHAVGVDFADGSPAEYEPGAQVSFDLSSLSMTAPTDVRDTEVTVSLDGAPLGTAPVTTTLSAPANINSNDEAGKASVSITLPADVEPGVVELTVTGNNSGTAFSVPLTVADNAPAESTVTAVATPSTLKVKKGTTSIAVDVTAGEATPTGTVEAYYGETLLTSAELVDGAATMELGPFPVVGQFPIEIRYSGDTETAPSSTEVTITVQKQTPRMSLFAPDRVQKGKAVNVRVVMAADNIEVSGRVKLVYAGRSITRSLVDGRVVAGLGTFNRTGLVTVKVTYLGNSLLTTVTKSVTFRVVN